MNTDLFGLRTKEIRAVLEAMKKVTPEEIKALHAARHAARHTLREPERDARQVWNSGHAKHAWDAWSAAREEQAAARSVMHDAAWAATWGAISALLVCDVITPEGFTQSKYEILVAPWESVFGKIELGK